MQTVILCANLENVLKYIFLMRNAKFELFRHKIMYYINIFSISIYFDVK